MDLFAENYGFAYRETVYCKDNICDWTFSIITAKSKQSTGERQNLNVK